MSEMISIKYLDFEQVLPHDAPSQPVRHRWVVAVVTQDQDDVLSRHQLAVSCCQINISLRGDLILDSKPPGVWLLITSRTAVGHSPCNAGKLADIYTQLLGQCFRSGGDPHITH